MVILFSLHAKIRGTIRDEFGRYNRDEPGRYSYICNMPIY